MPSAILRTVFLGVLLALSSTATATTVPADVLKQLPLSDEDIISSASLSVSPNRTFLLVATAWKTEAQLGPQPWLNRSLRIFERLPTKSYRLVARNDDVILTPFDAGGAGNGCDPFEGRTIAVKGAYFTVENGIACGAHWTDFVTFRFDQRADAFVFDNWRVQTWSMNPSNDPNAEALVSDGQKVVRAGRRLVRFEDWARPDSPTSRHCSVADVQACSAMWALVGRADFKLALRRFLGPGKATWTEKDADKTEQVLTTLSVSSEDPTPVGDGLIRLGSCFPHNCPERAEVFFGEGGKIKAVALLYHDCMGRECSGDEDYTLRILVREQSAKLIGYAKEWAEEDMRRSHDSFPQFEPETLSRVIVDVIEE